MKVLDLACAEGHGFEGWFASEDDFLAQNGAGSIACPVCGDAAIVRRPSAPRIALRRGSAPAAAAGPRVDAGDPAAVQATSAGSPVAAPPGAMPPAALVALQGQFLRAVRHVLANTEDVGPRFAEEARRIHYGEAEERGIRGQATPKEAEALRDEGIEVMALPMPDALKGPLQ